MLSIFQRKNKEQVKKSGLDSSVSANELFDESEISDEEEVHTGLSVHPNWNIPQEQMYVLQFLNNDLDPLKPNQISLAGVELRQVHAGLEATAFVRNSLAKGIKFEKVNLLLLDATKEVIARHEFDLSEMGEIPGTSSRPWSFLFPSSSIEKDQFNTEDWTIAFELKKNHALDLHDSWEKSIAAEDKEQLEKLVQSMTPPKQGEVNFMGLSAKLADTGELHVSVLIRNGHDKNINIQQLPLQLEDADGEVIAKGGFKLEDFEVKANTSKPWTFIFPASLVMKNNPNLSKWRVYPIQ